MADSHRVSRLKMNIKKSKTTEPKAKTGRKDHPLVPELPQQSHEKIHEALLYLEDLFDRAQMQFILLDDIAKQMWEQEYPTFEMREIDIGVREKDLTHYGTSTLAMLCPQIEWDKQTIYIEYKDVPIVVWKLNNYLDVFQHPDVRFYCTTQFYIPNPFKSYWNKRNLIK